MQNHFKSDDIAPRIKYLMKKMELNQSGMAKAFGLSNTAMSQYLTGKRTPAIEMLAKIVTGAQNMGLDWVTMDFMVFGKDVRPDVKVVKGSIIDRNYDLLTAKILDIVQKLSTDQKRTLLKLIQYMTSRGSKNE